MKPCIFTLLITLSFFSCKEKENRLIDRTVHNAFDKNIIALGKKLFFDTKLSSSNTQSCASCHAPSAAFSDPLHRTFHEGAVKGRFSNRNAPMLAYAFYSPSLLYYTKDAAYMGGYFWDGKANSLEEQVEQPLLNPLEMNNANIHGIVQKIKAASYYADFKEIYGNIKDDSLFMNQVKTALANYERSTEFAPFSSKYDYYLKGEVKLSPAESRGLALFENPKKGNCTVCHPTQKDEDSEKVLFTDFGYQNIGVPKNNNSPYLRLAPNLNPYGITFIDYGLGMTVKKASENGKFKVPSLRNVAITAPYFHNGYFATLAEVIHFYNVRDIEKFDAPEYPATVNHKDLGNLKLSKQEEKDLLSFLYTLTDGYRK